MLIRVDAVGLNPGDALTQKMGSYMVTKYPLIRGLEAAGTVVEVGEGVTSFVVGDQVCVCMSSVSCSH